MTFEENQYTIPQTQNHTTGGIIGFLLKKGIVKKHKHAEIFLLFFSALMLIVMGTTLLWAFDEEEFESDVYPDGYLNDPNYELQ